MRYIYTVHIVYNLYKINVFFIIFKTALTREKLINIGLLSGCDYSAGIENIGPVTSMEIFVEFEGNGFEVLNNLK